MPRTSNILLGDDDLRAREQEDEGLFQFGAGFSAGIKQTQGLLGGGLPALIASAIGSEEDATEYLNYYNDKMQEAAEIGGDFQRIEDIDGAEDAVQWLSYTLGQALPSIGTSIIGGGVGGAAVQYGAKKFIAETVENQVKQKAGKAFEKAMVKRELNRRTQKARRIGQTLGAVATSTGMNAGETFANVYEESGGIQDPALALATGLAAGSLDALAPLSILKKVLPDNMSEPFRELMADRLLRNKGMVNRAFIEGVRTGGIEGATEAAQELLQAAAVGMFNDPQGGYKSYSESFFEALNNPTEQQRSQYLNAFAAGFVGGGGMGGVSGAFYKPRSAPEAQEADPQQSPMPDSEGRAAVDTPQSEELEAQQAGFESYADYLDAYENGPAMVSRAASIEAVQNIIPDEFYMGQDLSPEQEAAYEAEAQRLREEFNPNLEDLEGQVVSQGDAEGVLRRKEDGTFFVRDFNTGEEVSIKTRKGKAGGDQLAADIGVERQDNTVQMERDSRVRFNPEDSTFTSPDRGDKPFRYIRTNYDQNGEVESVTAEVVEGSTAGEERVFKKRMAQQIDAARLQAEGATALQETRDTLAQSPTQQNIEGNLADRAQEGQPEIIRPAEFTPQSDVPPPPAPAVMTDMADVDIADRVATSIASAIGDAIRTITSPQQQTPAQTPARPPESEDIFDVRAALRPDAQRPAVQDASEDIFDVRAALQPDAQTQPVDDGRMGAADVQGMLEDAPAAEQAQPQATDESLETLTDYRGDQVTVEMRRDSAPRGATRRPVVTDEELNTVIDRVVGGNQETRNLINVVDRFDQLPAELQEAARQQGSDGSDVDAVSHNGQIYIVKGRMKSASRLERALLHEGTHGGINQMFADVDVSRALNAMFNAMGGQKGFDRIVDELGIREQLKAYEQGAREAKYSKETRNYIMVSEMLAYTGEEGGKTLKSRIREVIGAIRDWFRRNGFARLSKMRASDIALIAKNAREDYFRNDQARQDGQPLFSRVRDRAMRDELGLYSNAEQTLLDEGDKIFKPSKKNPEARVKGDQILSFLKARGLKKEENRYTKLEQFLTDPASFVQEDSTQTIFINRLFNSVESSSLGEDGQLDVSKRTDNLVKVMTEYFKNRSPDDRRPTLSPEAIQELNALTDGETSLPRRYQVTEALRSLDISQIIEMSGKPADRFTREEVIDFLQDRAPDLEEQTEVGFGEDFSDAEVSIRNQRVLDDTAYFEHYWDDFNYSMRQNEWDDYGPREILSKLMQARPETISELISVDLQQDEIEQFNPDGLAQAYADKGLDLYESLNGSLETILDEITWEVAEEYYMEAPEYAFDIYVGGEYFGDMYGNDDTSYRATTESGRAIFDEVYDFDEARVQIQQYAMDEGLVRDAGETRWFSHLKIDPRDVVEYREKVVTLRHNNLSPNIPFTGGHFGENNMLFAVLMTERQTPYGKAIAIEEMQSDWHSAIRKAGAPFDSGELEALRRDAEQAQGEKTARANAALEAVAEIKGPAGLEGVSTVSLFETVRQVHNFDKLVRPLLTEKGLELYLARIEAAQEETNSNDYAQRQGWLEISRIYGNMAAIWELEKHGFTNFADMNEMALERFSAVGKDGLAQYSNNFFKLYGQDVTDFQENDRTRAISEGIKKAGELLDEWQIASGKASGIEDKIRKLKTAPPDSPFRNDQYLDLAVKGVIRDAVDEGADVIALSKAQRVQARWSDNFDYEAIYNGKTKKILEKLTGSPAQQMNSVNERMRSSEGNERGFWVFEITDELREQVRNDGMPMYRRVTDQSNSHEDASNKGQLLNGDLSSNEFTLDDETRGELFLRRIQDKYLPLKKFEEAAAKFLGLKELPDYMQTYVGETLHSGKQMKDMDDLEKQFIEPLVKIMQDNDLDVDDLGMYLIAKHAKERNEYIATINQKMPDGGSGMLTADAERVVEQLENPSMIKAAQVIYDMLAANRKRMKDFGLVDESTIDAWQDRYQFYVPLKGFATSEKDGEYIPPRGNLPKGFNISGKEVFKALGRQSQSENPVLFAIADSEQKIVRARRSEPSRQFLNLADAMIAEGSDQFVVYRPDDEYPTEPFTDARGQVTDRRMGVPDMRRARRRNGDKRFLSVKKDGEEIFIEIKNDALNRTMHNVGSENYDGLVNFLGSAADKMRTFQNFRRNMLINWNPSWFLINPLRDLQTGLMYNLAQESKEGGMTEGQNLTGEILRRYLPAYSAYYKNLRGNKADNEYDAYYEEYTEAGAPTGLTLTKDIDEQRDRLFKMVTDGPLKRAGKQGLREIEHLNTASENAIRFATYVSARESGVSVQKAANLAKNLTVNFNRKGEISDGLNLFYLFFNAAVQGTANIAQAMSGRTADGKLTKAQIGAASIALLAYMVTQHNLGASEEDMDGESLYNDLSDYDHLMSWNMVLDDGKTFAQIPMPYGYGFFHTLGRLGAEFMNDTKDAGDVAAEMTASFAHHMLPPPLGFVGSVGKVDDLDEFIALTAGNVAPTIFEPVVQYATNTNHFGAPLYLEDNPLIKPPTPDSSRAKRSTSQLYRDIAEWMNDATGGSLYRSGFVDVSPDGMQYLQEYLLGGLGRFVNRSSDLAAKINSPENEEVTPSDIPIVRYFFGEPSDYSDKLDYYNYIDSATQVFKEASETTGPARQEFIAEFGKVVALEPLYKETQKQLRKLRQQKKQVEKTQSDPVKAYDQVQRIEAEMQKLFDQFNKRYREATK